MGLEETLVLHPNNRSRPDNFDKIPLPKFATGPRQTITTTRSRHFAICRLLFPLVPPVALLPPDFNPDSSCSFDSPGRHPEGFSHGGGSPGSPPHGRGAKVRMLLGSDDIGAGVSLSPGRADGVNPSGMGVSPATATIASRHEFTNANRFPPWGSTLCSSLPPSYFASEINIGTSSSFVAASCFNPSIVSTGFFSHSGIPSQHMLYFPRPPPALSLARNTQYINFFCNQKRSIPPPPYNPTPPPPENTKSDFKQKQPFIS